jgi:hypothetical protein
METTLPERRTGARWLAATGACLLAAAAALFVAVRWDELPDTARFIIVVAFTATCLGVGLRLRPSLPATGDALFHLGAILLPIDLSALNLRIHLGWRGLLLAEGVLVTVGLGGLGVTLGSAVLRRAGVAGGVALAAGLGAVSGIPAALVLAAMAVAAIAVRMPGSATVWAATAGFAPLLSAVAAATPMGDGTLSDLGFAGDGRLLSTASGLLAALVLGRIAVARRDLAYVVVAASSLAIGAADGWFRTDPGFGANASALASLFLLTRIAELGLRNDPFWGGPVRWVGTATEVVAGLATAPLVLVLAAAPLFAMGPGDAHLAAEALAAAVLAVAWAIAAVRQTALRAWPLAAAGVATAVSVEMATGRPLLAGIGMAVTSAGLLLVATRHAVTRLSVVTAAASTLAVWGTVTAAGSDVAVVLGSAVALGLTVAAARLHSRTLPVAAALGLGIGIWSAVEVPNGTAVALAVGGTWALTVLASALGSPRAAAVSRSTIMLPLVALPSLEPREMVASLVLATAAFVVEAVRTDDERYGYVAAGLSQLMVLAIATAAGLTAGRPGVALCAGAVVAAGLAAIVDDHRWRQPFLVAAGLGTGLGTAVATIDPSSFATAAMITGAVVFTGGVAVRKRDLAHLGAALVTAGLLGHLWLAGMGASEAYLAPVAANLLVVGHDLRRRTATPSWEAYAPAIVLLGGAAFAERLAGGAGWHAVVAGGVAVAAVAVGGWARLAGPLLTGTALLTAVTVHESLAVTAGVPTWAWLAASGSALLGTGVLLERNDTSPLEAGRRLVDVVAERFD